WSSPAYGPDPESAPTCGQTATVSMDAPVPGQAMAESAGFPFARSAASLVWNGAAATAPTGAEPRNRPLRKGRCRVDRCALFVDAGYLLSDGAMAVHGTRRREDVSWDHSGLLERLNSLARERTGLPVLRCYWYEATVEGRRTPEHDTLADLPGLKLRRPSTVRSEEHTSELQSRENLVCRLLLEKKIACTD